MSGRTLVWKITALAGSWVLSLLGGFLIGVILLGSPWAGLAMVAWVLPALSLILMVRGTDSSSDDQMEGGLAWFGTLIAGCLLRLNWPNLWQQLDLFAGLAWLSFVASLLLCTLLVGKLVREYAASKTAHLSSAHKARET